MRLRLDKLVLSAGLALAMVATTIPVIPVKAATTATVGIYSGSTEVTLGADFAATVTGVKTTGTSDVNDTIVKTEEVGTVTEGTGTLNATLGGNSEAIGVTNYLTKYGLKAVTDSTIKPSTNGVIVTQKTTYTDTYKYVVTAKDLEDENNTAETLANAAVTAANKELAAVTGEDQSAVSITGGTKAIDVGNLVPAESGNGWTDKTGESVSTEITLEAGYTYTYKVSSTVTTTYTITDLTSFGYTAKYTVPGTTAATSGKNIYKVLKLTDATNGGIDITEVTSTSADETVTFEVTDDLTAKYMVAYSTESTSDALITGNTAVEGYTITIAPSDGTDDATAKHLIDEYISSNGYTKVSYLNITVTDDNSNEAVEESTTDFTFTIKVPTDIGTDGITYTVLRMHNGVVEALETTVADGVITFTSNKFSDFALVYTTSAATPEDPTEEATDSTDGTTVADATDATAAADSTADSSTTSTTASKKTGDNSMMPLFMTTLLLALCAGSLAIYKEKKTN